MEWSDPPSTFILSAWVSNSLTLSLDYLDDRASNEMNCVTNGLKGEEENVFVRVFVCFQCLQCVKVPRGWKRQEKKKKSEQCAFLHFISFHLISILFASYLLLLLLTAVAKAIHFTFSGMVRQVKAKSSATLKWNSRVPQRAQWGCFFHFPCRLQVWQTIYLPLSLEMCNSTICLHSKIPLTTNKAGRGDFCGECEVSLFFL